MLDRLLFATRRFGLDLGGWLGSWRLSVVLMIVAAQYYVFLAIWAGSSPPHVVQNIAALLPFLLVYALLLVNTGTCLWRRIPTLNRELSRTPFWTELPPDWELPDTVPAGLQDARRWMRRNGYRLVEQSPERMVGIRRRWSGLGTFLFHGAFFLIALGFLATTVARQEATVWVAAGETYSSLPEQFLTQSPPRILATGIPERPFTVERITAEFWRDQLLFTKLEAELVLAGGRRKTTRINRPLWLSPATFLRLSGFGYAPRYELVARDGTVLDGAFVKMNLFPPGQRDHFVLPGYPHRCYIEIFPDLAFEGDEPVTKSFDLAHPAVLLRVFRGRLDLGGRLLLEGQGYEFEGLTLRFPEIRHWGEFSIVHDPGAPLIFLGFAVGLAGLLLRLRGRRGEAEWRAALRDGSPTLRGWGAVPQGRN